MSRFAEIWHLYRHELRSVMRERSLVMSTILTPLLLYPLMLWLLLQGLTFIQGREERTVGRVAIAGDEVEVGALEALLAGARGLDLEPADATEPADILSEERAEVWLRVAGSPKVLADGDIGRGGYELYYDSSREASEVARRRVESALDRQRGEALQEVGESRLPAEDWTPWEVETRNVADERTMGRFMLGLVVPLFFVIMVATGCIYPAVDTFAGERERGTWETTVSTAASRSSIVAAKFLYVSTLGVIAGLLNLIATALSFGAVLAPLTGSQGLQFDIPLVSWMVIVPSAILLAMSLAAAMIPLTLHAKTFREGQSAATVVYMLAILPVLVLNREGLVLDRLSACIPIANVVLLLRGALTSAPPWGLAALTFLVQIALTAALLLITAHRLRRPTVRRRGRGSDG